MRLRNLLSTDCLCYVLVAFVLVLLTFDWTSLAQVALLFCCFCVGFLSVAVYHGACHSDWLLLLVSHSHPRPSKTSVGQLSGRHEDKPPRLRMDKRLTGATTIDQPMQELLDLTFRDCVEWWYYEFIGTSPFFLHELRRVAQHVVVAFANKSKAIDWVPFFSQRLVDDFATHLRLYRAAQEKLAKKHLSGSQFTHPEDGIVDAFFDMESDLDSSRPFRNICSSVEKEQEYLRDVSEILLYLLLPPDDFHNKTLRLLAREVLISRGLLPTVETICDPDYVNQTIVWLCYDWAFTPEAFTDIVRHSCDLAEVSRVEEKVEEEMARLRAKDRDVADSTVKQELSSLKYVKDKCSVRRKELQCVDSDGDDHQLSVDKSTVGSERVIPFYLVLANSSTFALFSDWIASDTEGLRYLGFWQNIEGFRVSAEQLQAACSEAVSMGTSPPSVKSVVACAQCLYDQYLSDNSLHMEPTMKSKVKRSLENQVVTSQLFCDIQKQIELVLELKFYPFFRETDSYQECLAETDWDGDVEDLEAGDDDGSSTASSETASQSVESLPTLLQESEGDGPTEFSGEMMFESVDQKEVCTVDVLKTEAEVLDAGVCHDSGQQYGVYAIQVTRHKSEEEPDVWVVPRRYSDFHDLHMILKETCHMTDVSLPGKRAFKRLSRSFLQKRKTQLNDYLQVILDSEFQAAHVGAADVVITFLSRGEYSKLKGELARRVDSIVSPLRRSVRSMSQTVKAVPSKLESGIDTMSRALKPGMSPRHIRFHPTTGGGENGDESKLRTSLLDSEDFDDNIPLRILLLLMDEVFDLKTRNLWLRRRIIILLKEIVKATFGDRINKKIIQKIESMTSSDHIAEYVRELKDSMWPDGIWRTEVPERDAGTQVRTRIAAKAKLLGTVPDDLKRFIGADTTREGVCRVFSMFQHSRLNKRLVYVVFEDLLVTVFPDNKFAEVFQRLHGSK